MSIYTKRRMTAKELREMDDTNAKLAQTTADIDYLAMMTGIELESEEEEVAEVETEETEEEEDNE